MSDGDEESGETEGKFHPIKILSLFTPAAATKFTSITSKSKEKKNILSAFLLFFSSSLFSIRAQQTFFRCF